MGQAFHFAMRKPRVDYGYERYTEETKRLLGVLDKRLGESEWLNGEGFSIAECAILPWINGFLDPARAEMAESMVGISTFKNLPPWVARCKAMDPVAKGLTVLDPPAKEEGK